MKILSMSYTGLIRWTAGPKLIYHKIVLVSPPLLSSFQKAQIGLFSNYSTRNFMILKSHVPMLLLLCADVLAKQSHYGFSKLLLGLQMGCELKSLYYILNYFSVPIMDTNLNKLLIQSLFFN